MVRPISNKTTDKLFLYLRDLLYYPNRAELDFKSLPEDFQELGEGMFSFGEMLKEMRTLAKDLSRGNLDCPLPSSDNELAASLKSMHATLKHLTWQVQQVAKGDYEQRVSFMGDFADAVNEMIHQLRERRDAMAAEMDKLQRKTNDLARSNFLFETIAGTIEEWIVMIDSDTGEHLFANHPVADELASDTLESQLYEILFDYAKAIGDDEGPRTEEFPLISDYAVQWFSVIFYPVKWYEHNAVACVLKDITSEKEQIQVLENVAYRDMLTGAYNRHFGMKLLNEWIRDKRHFVICFIDMDRLKYVNDVFGHAEGDKYILKIADILSTFSPDAHVVRLGGDEFMLLALGFSIEEADKRFECLRRELIADDYVSEDGQVRYKRSLSYGNVEVKEDNTTVSSELLSMADEKMYEYKKAHKLERRE
ncbi:MAG: GGDEF domain-containing protein [Clostridiales Family XIII bacterium]|jgi:diguanylate cyclase (GGDEF)-like protein|nr:GGDEF domain-containing protein [Clostridiales Family XIII bacterium]